MYASCVGIDPVKLFRLMSRAPNFLQLDISTGIPPEAADTINVKKQKKIA